MLTLLLILLPLIGTALGAAVVCLRCKPEFLSPVRLNGFAAGVMTAASLWSLLLPAIDRSAGDPIPALAGLWAGFLFLHGLETTPQDSLLRFAVSLHNLPEGMAVGAAVAAWEAGEIGLATVAALSLGIAIQNIPEGAIISLPLQAEGALTGRALLAGIGSGVIEPMGAILTILLSELALPALPYLLSFSAGAMLFVVVSELVTGKDCTLWFAAGFSLMMTLDVVLG